MLTNLPLSPSFPMLTGTHRPLETRITDFEFQKYAKFKPHSVILQNKFINYSYDENGNRVVVKPDLSQKNRNSLLNLEKGASGQWNGFMSPGTRRKVKGIIENYLTAVQMNTSMVYPKSYPSLEVYPVFLTLTLPSFQVHSDNEIKRDCFQRFIEWLTGSKEKGNSGWNVKNYIWVAETQKNHNIHFHLLIDRALPKDRINEKWNQIIERLGYVTRYRNLQNYRFKGGWYVRQDMLRMKIANERKACRANKKKFNLHDVENEAKKKQFESYQNGVASGWKNPPSSKIHSIRSIQKLTAYVSKYMTKAAEPDVKLSEGETLVQENGKYFIESEGVQKFTSHEGIELETVNPERREIKVEFKTRPIEGRLWGASKPLHSKTLAPYTIPLETTPMVITTTYDYRTVTISQPEYTTNIFGERVFSHMAKIQKENVIRDSVRDFGKADQDHDAFQYVRFLREMHVKKEDIERATARAGGHFQHYGGVIIPLEFHQKDVLKMFSPLMHKRYADYYKTIYQKIYETETD